MKFPGTLLLMLIICGLLVFKAQHHRRDASLTKPCTLGEIYKELLGKGFAELGSKSVGTESSRAAFWSLLIGGTGMLAAIFPVLFLGLLHWMPPTTGRTALYIAAGLMAMVGAASNFLAMLVSHMVIGFGTSQSRDHLPFLWIIPTFQGVTALCCVGSAVSGRFGIWLGQLAK